MRLLVDTGAWFALNNRDDRWHRAAVSFVQALAREPVVLYTTDYIIDEAVTLLRFRASHPQAVAFLDSLVENPNVIRKQVTDSLLAKAEEIFRRYRDKRWSFTDCVSFAFMDEMGLEDAFAFDSNFSQYGKILHPRNGS